MTPKGLLLYTHKIINIRIILYFSPLCQLQTCALPQYVAAAMPAMLYFATMLTSLPGT